MRGAQRKEREKGPAHGFKEALDFASGRGVVGSRVDQGHAQAGPGEREQTAGERGAIVTIQDLGQAMASEGFLEGGPDGEGIFFEDKGATGRNRE